MPQEYDDCRYCQIDDRGSSLRSVTGCRDHAAKPQAGTPPRGALRGYRAARRCIRSELAAVGRVIRPAGLAGPPGPHVVAVVVLAVLRTAVAREHDLDGQPAGRR